MFYCPKIFSKLDKIFSLEQLDKCHDKQRQKEKKMTKINTETETNNFSVLQVLGTLFLVFAAADFILSWMGVNLTPFMGLHLDFHQLSLV